MPNYKSTAVTGESWNRFFRLLIENPLYMPEAGEYNTPSIRVSEEEITPRRDGKVVHQTVGNLFAEFEAAKTFPLLNPETDVATGATMTHAEYYAITYSLVMAIAAERDNNA